MRTSRLLAAALAATLFAASDVGAQPPPVMERTGAGWAPDAGSGFPDANFQHAYSFSVRNLSPGSGGTDAVLGAIGPCTIGQSCQATAERTYRAGAEAYAFGLSFGGSYYGSPTISVASWGDWTSGTDLELTGYVPGSLNAFYVVLRSATGTTLDIRDLLWIGAPPSLDTPGFGTTPGGTQYALYTSEDDLRDNFLYFDLYVDGIAGSDAERPSLDVYVGTLAAAQVVPEPSTVALTGLGLVGLLGVAVRRRRTGAER